ncbi:unnamed protein product [Rotaria socialis]|uniref:Endonuclease/exonuclease/phosphatase domain-containing protein n=3 Tax=Rotaria socialis TaxID=392032 RepID=A0A818WQ95_9BILA|nr:unnamed protein product [Rotaria socialis]
MSRINIDILGISELKWTGMGHFISDDYHIFYCGQENHRRNGVAIIVNKRLSNSVLGYNPKNDRIISIRLLGKPINVTVIQVYAPTTGADDEEIEDFYVSLQQLVDATPKKDTIVIMGGWNAKVGSKPITGITGNFELGDRNEAGDRLLEFCQNNLFITNTCFQQPKRRLYTWTSPNGQYKNQIDYILCSQRWRSSIQLAKTRPGADCGSDHELLIAKFPMKLKTTCKTARPARARRDKEKHINGQCQQIKDNNQKGKTRDLLKKIDEIKRTFHAKNGTIKDKQGRDLMEKEDIKKRWREYTEELYKKDTQSIDETDGSTIELEPGMLESEIKRALECIANNKAPGINEIPAELFKILGDDAVKILLAICQQIWKTQQWPKYWKRSIYIPIPKKRKY